MALSCRKNLTDKTKIAADIRMVGIDESSSPDSTVGVEDILTIKTVGMKFKTASKYGAFIRGVQIV